MPAQDAYSAINRIFKGKVGAVENSTRSIVLALDGMNSIENQAAYTFLTSRDFTIDQVPVNTLQKNALIKAKLSVDQLGESLVEMGVLSRTVYEANKGTYLHSVYMQYLTSSKGGGKRTSFMSYLKKSKNLTVSQQDALGKVTDVKYLLAETLGTMGRDHVLLQLFDSISSSSLSNKLYWVLTKDAKIPLRIRQEGEKGAKFQQVTIDQAYSAIDMYKAQLLNISEIKRNQSISDPKLDADEVRLTNSLAELQANVDSIETRALDEAHQHALQNRSNTPEDKHEFLKNHYVRLPNKTRFGALRNKLVRKEIANDLDAYTAAFTLLDSSNNIEEFFAKGGTMDRIHSTWKMSKVALNPGSWMRNIMGNFALLDLSTSTNKFKLIGMVVEEARGALGDQSKYWKLASEYGLFGSTFSAVELQDMYESFADEMDVAIKTSKDRKHTPMSMALHFTDERLHALGRILSHKSSKGYALVEGAFKTVALRDYIETWESQNKGEFPGGHKSLSKEQQQILYSKAAKHADDALFDYSQVNNMVKTLRRIPFGSPFITFAYKAFPASVKAMVNHPIKFAEYAALPALLTQVAMMVNDWDDDDIKNFRKALPDYYRNNPGVAFLPFKDSQGRVQILPLDYILPWSQFSTAARKIYENYVQDGGESPISTTLQSVGTLFNEFGVMGGPAPTSIAAMVSGIDPFTERSIITPGASGSQQMGEAMTFAYNMAVPSFMTSSGWFSKIAKSGILGNDPEVNRFGDVIFTPGQAVSDITGFRAIGIDQKAGVENRKIAFQKEQKDISSVITKAAKDMNLSNEARANKIKDAVERLKLTRMRMQKELS